MSVIIQLSPVTINRIAAGEVVERPASVVKELVENAIDAGADRIEVVTSGGGKTLIRVTDNGVGMTSADLSLAVERHCTSKLIEDDLLDIRTLGFRGEALPSIGSVADLRIETRHASEDNGWAITVAGGSRSDIMPVGLSQGTRIEVRNLFFSTPARLKFLKSERARPAPSPMWSSGWRWLIPRSASRCPARTARRSTTWDSRTAISAAGLCR